MLDLFIILVLFIGVYSGYKKGVVLQLLEAIGYVIVAIFALDYYKLISGYFYLLVPYPTPFAPESNPYLYYNEEVMLSMDMTYYDLLGFLAIFLVGWAVVKFLSKFISYTLEKLRAPEPLSGVSGGFVGFLVNYIGIFFILVILTTIPYGFVQNNLKDSIIADKMITSTPKISDEVYQVFVLDVHEEASKNLPTMDIEVPTTEDENTEESVEENQE